MVARRNAGLALPHNERKFRPYRHVPRGEQAWATNIHMLGQTTTNGMAASSHNARFPPKHSANINDAIQAQANQMDIWMA